MFNSALQKGALGTTMSNISRYALYLINGKDVYMYVISVIGLLISNAWHRRMSKWSLKTTLKKRQKGGKIAVSSLHRHPLVVPYIGTLSGYLGKQVGSSQEGQ